MHRYYFKIHLVQSLLNRGINSIGGPLVAPLGEIAGGILKGVAVFIRPPKV